MGKIRKKYIGSEAIKKVIAVWGNYYTKLRGVHKNSHIYDEMCRELSAKHGITLTSSELQNRIHNLTKKYRQKHKIVEASGGVPSKWDHYEEIHKIFGSCKFNLAHELSEDSIDIASVDLDSPSEMSLLASDKEFNVFASSEETPPTQQSPKKIKRKIDVDFYELAKKEQKMMENYLQKSLNNEEKALSLLEQNNALLLAIVNKI